MTIRNITKNLRYLFKVALRSKLIPGLAVNPTQGDEFRDEMKGLDAVRIREAIDILDRGDVEGARTALVGLLAER
jgi:hypothetical protein